MEITNAYMAGLLDGEGYIAISNNCVGKSKKYLRLVVKISMVDDVRLLESVHSKWGGYIRNRKARSVNHRSTVEWVLENSKAEVLLQNLYPYMVVKKQQAGIGIEFRKFVSYNNNITDNVVVYRQHLADGLKGLHHSIPFTINQTLRKRALKDVHTKRFISRETLQKLSDSHKGKHHAGTFKKGSTPWTTGRKLTEEHKKKIGEANKIAVKKYHDKLKGLL